MIVLKLVTKTKLHTNNSLQHATLTKQVAEIDYITLHTNSQHCSLHSKHATDQVRNCEVQ